MAKLDLAGQLLMLRTRKAELIVAAVEAGLGSVTIPRRSGISRPRSPTNSGRSQSQTPCPGLRTLMGLTAGHRATPTLTWRKGLFDTEGDWFNPVSAHQSYYSSEAVFHSDPCCRGTCGE